MANFKRKKTKRNVRCTMCTDYRWMGNNKGRKKPVVAEARDRQKLQRLVAVEQF